MSDQIRTVHNIKKLGIVAMFSDDELLEEMVLKGGNAMDIVYQASNRSSVDLDFSMERDFPEGFERFSERIKKTLEKEFLEQMNLKVFDAKIFEQPKGLRDDPSMEFWGGYGVEFKLIDQEIFEANENNIEVLRKLAIDLGQGPKFLIDISKHEYVVGKREVELDGYRIYVYSPEMIVCEKLRAICQTTKEYGPIVKRNRGIPKGRAKDFLDIYLLVEKYKIDMTSDENFSILREMFNVKKVPMDFLDLMENYRDLHRTDFPSVEATVRLGKELKQFDFYFNYCLNLRDSLKSLRDK